MIRELREENEKLKKVLIQMAQGGPINLKELEVNDLTELLENLEENSKAMDDMQKPWDQKLKEEKERERINTENKALNKEDRRVPHLTNLNEDPQLTGRVYYSLLNCKYLLKFHNFIRPCLCWKKKWKPEAINRSWCCWHSNKSRIF